MIVGGLSIGAILALRLAALQPDRVHGIACFAPTLWYDGWTVPKHQFLLRWFWFLPPAKRYSFTEREPFGVKDERMRAFVMKSIGGGDTAIGGHPSSMPCRSINFGSSSTTSSRGSRGSGGPSSSPMRATMISRASRTPSISRSTWGLVEVLVLDDSYHIVTIDRQWKVLVDHAIRFAQAIERHRGAVLLELTGAVNMPLRSHWG